MLCLTLTHFTALGNGLEMKLKGGFEFQSGFNKNNGKKIHNYVSKNKEHLGFNTSANFSLNIVNKVDMSFEYGAKIGIETTSKNDRRAASSLYLLSDYGKIEAGSEKSANTKMKITGSTIACGTGGGWDSWVTLPLNANYVSYITNNSSYLDAKSREMTKAEYARKITYYTPKYRGFQIGLSYVADTTNAGYTSLNQPVYHSPVKLSPYYHSMRDGIAYGISYEHDFDKDVKIETSFVGEKAKVDSFSKSNKQKVKAKVKDLNTYTLGSVLKFEKYAVALSYADHLKSITQDDANTKNRDSKIYSIGGRYKHNNYAVSLNLFTSDHRKNSVQAVTLATEYKLAPGLLPYIELTNYKTNGSYIKDSNKVTDKIVGWLLLGGIKLEL